MSSDEGPDDAAATALLVLTSGEPDAAALARLYAALDQRGFRRGHLVGPVLPVTATPGALQTLADYVDVVTSRRIPPDADGALVDALAPVQSFAWDEGAETF